MRTLIIFILTLSIASCSVQKRAARALKRIGADPLLSEIQKSYPDKFYNDTTPRYITITKVDTFEYVTTSTIHDTIVKDTCYLDYEDKNLRLSINGTKLKYHIKSKVEKVVSPPKVHTVKCPDCPPIPKPVKEPAKKDYTFYWIIFVLISFVLGMFFGVKYAKN